MAKSTKMSGRKAVPITCRAPQAKHVYVAGTFNGWSTTATPLTQSDGGEWKAELKLLPGRYEFKLVVDDVWCCEPDCDGPHHGCPKCVANPFGTMNRFIDVK